MGDQYDIDRDDQGLTNQERRVLDLLAEGMNGAQIGKVMGLSRQRVAALRKSAKTRLNEGVFNGN